MIHFGTMRTWGGGGGGAEQNLYRKTVNDRMAVKIKMKLKMGGGGGGGV